MTFILWSAGESVSDIAKKKPFPLIVPPPVMAMFCLLEAKIPAYSEHEQSFGSHVGKN